MLRCFPVSRSSQGRGQDQQYYGHKHYGDLFNHQDTEPDLRSLLQLLDGQGLDLLGRPCGRYGEDQLHGVAMLVYRLAESDGADSGCRRCDTDGWKSGRANAMAEPAGRTMQPLWQTCMVRLRLLFLGLVWFSDVANQTQHRREVGLARDVREWQGRIVLQ